MAIDLTGRHEDHSRRAYVVMQDDVQRTDRNASIVFVRTMRERDETVEQGTIYIGDETFIGAGPDDHARNAAIAGALVRWIAGRSAAERLFQLRASLTTSDAATTVEMRNETYAQAEP